MRFLLNLIEPLYFSGGGMPAPQPMPQDPSTTPEAIEARNQAARDAEISAQGGLERNIVAGRKIAAKEAQQNGMMARTKLGY